MIIEIIEIDQELFEAQERAAEEYRTALDRGYDQDAFDAQWVWD